MLKKRGPAFAGLFFALSFASIADANDIQRLDSQGQVYFRRFIELFTPAVLAREKALALHAPSGAAWQPAGNQRGSAANNYRWDKTNRDCAGLVRYLFWEAMQSHNTAFFEQYSAMRSFATSTPPTGLIRLQHTWSRGNLTASELIARSHYLGRNISVSSLKTGDLLFFQSNEWKIRHVMLVVRSSGLVYLVYHTGDTRDELRIRTVEDIQSLPETQWHPEAQNPVFRGIYRPLFLAVP